MTPYQKLKEVAYKGFAKLQIEDLKKQAAKLMNETSEESNLVWHALMSYLEDNMPENEYIEFCDNL